MRKITWFCIQNKTSQGQKVVSHVLNRAAKWAIFVLNRVRVWRPRRHSSTQTSLESPPDWGSPIGFFNLSFRPLFSLNPLPRAPNGYFRHSGAFHAYFQSPISPPFCSSRRRKGSLPLSLPLSLPFLRLPRRLPILPRNPESRPSMKANPEKLYSCLLSLSMK